MEALSASVTADYLNRLSPGSNTPSPYSEVTTLDLAASYAVSIAKNHPFLDGNKRTA
jgi:prophage maintenance system killer protein